MLRTTLVFIFDEQNRILLAMKKRGFGAGHWNGAGGKLLPEETVLAGIVRELQEETGILLEASRFEEMGMLHFRFPYNPSLDQKCSVFRVTEYTGPEPIETDEMRPEWFNIGEIPYGSMWADDIYWLPDLILGEQFEWTFAFDEAGGIREKMNHLAN